MEELSKSYHKRLRDTGHKLTNARLTVLNVIENAHGHLTSTEILEQVAVADPSIGRASVFRTLDLLTRLGIIRPTYVASSATPHYVLLPDGHHHHIICMNCNRLIEFGDCELEGLAASLEARYGVHITGHLLEFYALCNHCQHERE